MELWSDRLSYALIMRMEVFPNLDSDNGFGFQDMNRSYHHNQMRNSKFNSGP